MRPKTDKMASDTEDVFKSFEGWKEALYEREDEVAGYVTPISPTRPTHTVLTYNANAQRKSYPQKVILLEQEATTDKDLNFECTFKTTADAADKNNVRWCIYVKEVHDSFTKVKKVKKDANNKDIDDITTQNAYTIITDRAEIADTDTNFLTSATKTDFENKAYLYARIEVKDGKSKLAIKFSKQLEGKEVFIEAFRGNPNLSGTKFRHNFTLQEKPKAKIIKKLTTDLFISANCLVEENNTSFTVPYDNKEVVAKLQTMGWHDPIINGEITLHNYDGVYKPKGSTFGKVRIGYNKKTKKLYKKPHTGLDIFAEKGTQLYACLDSKVKSIGVVGLYGNVIVLEIDIIDELKLAKNKYQLKYTNEIEIGPNFNLNDKIYLRYAHVESASVKVGQRVNAGDPIGLSGISGNAKKTYAPHLHFEITNKPAPPKGLNYKCNPSFYVNIIPEELADKTNQERVVVKKRKEVKR